MSALRPAPSGRAGRSGLGLAAATFAFLLPTAFSPSTESVFWAPKWALLLPLVGIGLPLLWTLARRSTPQRSAARSALALLVVATVSTLLAPSTWMAVLGVHGFGTGLVFLCAALSAWALGASLSAADRSLLGAAVVAAGVVTAVVAVLETTVDLRAFELGLFGGRAIGLQGNPVHVGPPLVAGFALLVGPFTRRPALVGAALVLLVAAVQAGGSRSALLALVAVSGWAMTRLSWARRALLALLLVAGLAGGDALVGVGGGTSISARVAPSSGAAGEGFGGRLDQWALSRHAVAERPVLGWGPGSYRAATSKDRTIGVARAFGPDTIFADAHNLVVEVLVTTGLLGLGVAGAFAWAAGRRARGSFAAAAVAALLVGLLQPMHPGTTVPAMLALGAAGPLLDAGHVRRAVAAWWVTVPAGVAAGTAVLLGQVLLHEATLDLDAATARRAEAVLPPWPLPSQVRARVATFEARTTGNDLSLLAEARRHQERALSRDPTDPAVLELLGDAYAAEGRLADAKRVYLRALRQNPPSVSLRNSLGALAAAEGRDRDARRWLSESLEIQPAQPEVHEQLDALR